MSILKNIRKVFLGKILYILASIFFLISNLLYILNGWQVRHRADDFCFSGTFREFGFLGGLRIFYLTLSNRFSAFILWSLSDLFGEKSVRVFSMAAILFVMVSLFIVVRHFAKKLSLKEEDFLAIFVSQIPTYFFLYLSPTIDQSVYWRAAMVHYFLPFPALLLLTWNLLKIKPKTKTKLHQLIPFTLFTFFLAGLSESYAALQGATFAVLMLFFLIYPRRKEFKHLAVYALAGIFSTLIVFLIMILSPGNSLKFSLLDQAPDLSTIIKISLSSAFDFIYFTIRGQWLPFIILFALGLTISLLINWKTEKPMNKKNAVISAAVMPLIIFILVFAICAPTAYGMSAYPEKRVLMLALMVLVLGVFVEGIFIGTLLARYVIKRRWAYNGFSILIILLSLYPLLSIPDLLELMTFYQKRAQLWDMQQEEILAQINQGETALVVTALDAHAEIAEMREYDTFWVNLCAAQYYNVDKISAIER